MPHANRYVVPGAIYHVTHRCHDRAFLFRFARDRDTYRAMMRDRLERNPVAALGYCIVVALASIADVRIQIGLRERVLLAFEHFAQHRAKFR